MKFTSRNYTLRYTFHDRLPYVVASARSDLVMGLGLRALHDLERLPLKAYRKASSIAAESFGELSVILARFLERMRQATKRRSIAVASNRGLFLSPPPNMRIEASFDFSIGDAILLKSLASLRRRQPPIDSGAHDVHTHEVSSLLKAQMAKLEDPVNRPGD